MEFIGGIFSLSPFLAAARNICYIRILVEFQKNALYLSRASKFRAQVHWKFSIIFNYTMLLQEYEKKRVLHAIKILCILGEGAYYTL